MHRLQKSSKQKTRHKGLNLRVRAHLPSLSLVSKLSPTRITSLMMGGWFLATSIGNKLSGVLATLWDTYEEKANFFWVNFSLLLFSAIIAVSLLKWLNNIMREKGIK